MAHLPLIETDESLLSVLREATSEDLGILVEYIHKAHSEDLSSVPDFLQHNPKANEKIYEGDHRIYADDIAAEIQRFGGNSISNSLRQGRGVPYIEIVRDVASQLMVKDFIKNDVEVIEQKIQIKIMERAYKKMSDQEKQEFLSCFKIKTQKLSDTLPATAFLNYPLAAIVSDAVSKQLLGRGLSVAASSGLARFMGAYLNLIGWGAVGVWALMGPAYRVTIPCVLQIAYMRQKKQTDFLMIEDHLNSISN